MEGTGEILEKSSKVYVKFKNNLFEIVLCKEGLKLFNKFKWRIKPKANPSNGYYLICGGKTTKYFHRVLTKCPKEFCVDHINGNTLDNRLSNLRVCEHKENRRNSKINLNNSTGYKGVDFVKSKNKYRARIKYNYKEIHLGMFNNAKEAASAYNKAAFKYFGKFANINKIKK